MFARALATATLVTGALTIVGAERSSAYWQNGRGEASGVVATLTAPGVVTATGRPTITLSWAAGTTNGAAALRYRIERRTETGTSWSPVCGTDVATMTGRSCTDTPTEGSYRYRSIALLGRWSATGPESDRLDVVSLTFRSAGTGSTAAGGGSATSLAIGMPSGVAIGDLLLAQVSFERGSDAGTDAGLTPTGWTLAARTNATNSFGQVVLWKVATSGDVRASSVTVSFSQSVRAAGTVLRYAGVDTTSPIAAIAGSSGSSASIVAPSVTGLSGGTLVAMWSVKRTAATITAPAGVTVRSSFQNTQDATGRAADEPRSAAGATGTRTATSSQSGDWVAHAVMLRPRSS